jgi:GTP-binding protein
MIIKNPEFLGSFQYEKQCPTNGMSEFAFIGRSNVGKSSLINMLCDKKGLAKVSQSPGKTQTLNFFTIDESWYLVDLPGYGYARASKVLRAGFGRMITEYFTKRETLRCAFVLIDGMLPPQKIDLEFIGFLGGLGVPFAFVITKTDRAKPLELKRNIMAFEQKVLEIFETMPNYFITSAEKRIGKQEIFDYMEVILKGK